MFETLVIDIEISTNRLTPYHSEDWDSSYYQLVLEFGFPMRYTCVSFTLFTAFIPRSTEKAKKNVISSVVL
jgi:hypothetical protein